MAGLTKTYRFDSTIYASYANLTLVGGSTPYEIVSDDNASTYLQWEDRITADRLELSIDATIVPPTGSTDPITIRVSGYNISSGYTTTATLTLKEGTTTIATDTGASWSTTSATEYTMTVPQSSWSSIGSWSNLSLEILVTVPNRATNFISAEWYVDIPRVFDPTYQRIGFKVASDAKIVTGNRHTCMLDAHGNLYAWGLNSYGECVTGDTNTAYDYTAIRMTDVADVACGNFHTAILKTNGDLYVVGGNSNGQCGTGSTGTSASDLNVRMTNINTIACGYSQTYAEGASSTYLSPYLLGCGYNLSQCISTGSSDGASISTFGYTGFVATGYEGEVQYSAGQGTCYALLPTGDVYAWGNNFSGQINHTNATTPQTSRTTIRVTGVDRMAAGYGHFLFTDSSNNLYAFGSNSNGQCNHTNVTTPEYDETTVRMTGVVEFTAGYNSTYALDASGNLYAWGYNAYGQINHTNTTTPDYTGYATARVTGLARIATQTSSSYHMVAVDTAGDVVSWGYNTSRQCNITTSSSPAYDETTPRFTWGVIDPTYSTAPTIEIGAAPGGPVVSTPASVTLTLTGYLGHQETIQPATIALTPGDAPSVNVGITTPAIATAHLKTFNPNDYQISAGRTIAVTDGTHVWSWGVNYYGGANHTNTTTPATDWDTIRFTAPTGTKVKKIVSSRGVDATRVLLDNGDLYGWGSNYYGEMDPTQTRGTGAYVWAHTPGSPLRTGIADFAVYGSHVLALDTSGNLYSWGLNGNRQSKADAGDSSDVLDWTTVRMANIALIAVGSAFSACVTTSGDLRTWGANHAGQCGIDNVTTTVTDWTTSRVNADIKKIEAGDTGLTVMWGDGSLSGCGNNQYCTYDPRVAYQQSVLEAIDPDGWVPPAPIAGFDNSNQNLVWWDYGGNRYGIGRNNEKVATPSSSNTGTELDFTTIDFGGVLVESLGAYGSVFLRDGFNIGYLGDYTTSLGWLPGESSGIKSDEDVVYFEFEAIAGAPTIDVSAPPTGIYLPGSDLLQTVGYQPTITNEFKAGNYFITPASTSISATGGTAPTPVEESGVVEPGVAYVIGGAAPLIIHNQTHYTTASTLYPTSSAPTRKQDVPAEYYSGLAIDTFAPAAALGITASPQAALLVLGATSEPVLGNAFDDATIVIDAWRRVHSWGSNEDKQLDLARTDTDLFDELTRRYGPAKHACAGWGVGGFLTYTGDLYLWGDNIYGQVNATPGYPTSKIYDISTPQLTGVQGFGLGRNFASALYDNGDWVIWGDNSSHQCSTTSTDPWTDRTTTRQYSQATVTATGYVACGYYHTAIEVVRTSDSALLYATAGNGRFYTNKIGLRPAIGYGHMLAASESGSMYAIGLNTAYRCSPDYATTADFSGSTASAPAGITDIIATACTYGSSAFIRANGDVHTWGANQYGECGMTPAGTRTDWDTVRTTGAVAITGGYGHFTILKANGDVCSWGRNDHGQVNHTNTTDPDLNLSTVRINLGAAGDADAWTPTVTVEWSGYIWGQPGPTLAPTSYAPTVDVALAELSIPVDGTDLAIATYAPTPVIEYSPSFVPVDGADLSIATYAPEIWSVYVPTTTLTIDPQLPTALVVPRPAATSFAVDAGTPVVTVFDPNPYVYPDAAALTITNYTPTPVWLVFKPASRKLYTTPSSPLVDLDFVITPAYRALSITQQTPLTLRGKISRPQAWQVELNALTPAIHRGKTRYPEPVIYAPSGMLPKLFLGEWTTFLLDELGRIHGWGNYLSHPQSGNTSVLWKDPSTYFHSGIVFVSASISHAAALTADGDLYTWGRQYSYETNPLVGTAPALYDYSTLRKSGVRDVLCRGNTTWAVMANGDLTSWGRNDYYQADPGSASATVIDWTSSRFSGVYQMDASITHVMVLKSNHNLYGWGRNNLAQVTGTGTTATETNTSNIIKTDVAKVVVNADVTFAIGLDGHLYGWGENTYGQIDPENISSYCITKKNTPIIENIVDVYSSSTATFAIGQDGHLYAWGRNIAGIIDPSKTDEDEILDYRSTWLIEDFTSSPLFGVERKSDLAISGARAMFLKSESEVIGWGFNYYFQTDYAASGSFPPAYRDPETAIPAIPSLYRPTITNVYGGLRRYPAPGYFPLHAKSLSVHKGYTITVDYSPLDADAYAPAAQWADNANPAPASTALTLTATAPSIDLDLTISVGAAALVVTAQIPVNHAPGVAKPAASTLVVTGWPVVSLDNDMTISPDKADIITFGCTPRIVVVIIGPPRELELSFEGDFNVDYNGTSEDVCFDCPQQFALETLTPDVLVEFVDHPITIRFYRV
jgi:alpha-tubulin suppressor-like RCC1 family protein